MSLARRIAGAEKRLSPTELVLRWLEEAHAHGSLEAYVAWLLEQDPPPMPLDRLALETIGSVTATMHSRKATDVTAAVGAALRETLLRYYLVTRINAVTMERLDRASLVGALIAARLALAAGARRSRHEDAKDRADQLAHLRDMAAARVGELETMAQARALVERRYLDGHPALFPDCSTAWDQQVAEARSLADLACRLADIVGAPHPSALQPDPSAVEAAVADLVESARAETLDAMGEGRQAVGIAASWLRGLLSEARVDRHV